MSISKGFQRMDELEIRWVGGQPKSVPLMVAMPDVGLISLLTAVNVINQSKMQPIGYLEAPWVPPAISIVNGVPLTPIRLYSDEKLAILISEVPVYANAWHLFSQLVVKVSDLLDSPLILGATGLPNQKRYSLDKLRVFVSYTREKLKEEYLKDYPNFSGLLAGPYAAIFKRLVMHNKPAILLLIDSYPNYPDPEAAARVSEIISTIIDYSIDVSYLLEKASEIKIMARKLAAEAQKAQSEIPSTGRPAVSFYM